MRLLLFALLFVNLAVPAQEPARLTSAHETSTQNPPRNLRPREAKPTAPETAPAPSEATAKEKRIAAQFAPIFLQGLGDNPRADYITNFDFDGDWKGDNNWYNLDKRNFALRAYIYYSVAETETHYFVHYAVFHPRDYKGGTATSMILDSAIRLSLPQLGKIKDPTVDKVNDVALSHENDLEGCLVVAEKHGEDLTQAQVLYVETMAHNGYYKYRTAAAPGSIGDPLELSGAHPRLYVEPKGHGLYRYTGDSTQINPRVAGLLTYQYTGTAEDHETLGEKADGKTIGYDLLSIYDSFWARATKGENDTFGETLDYQKRSAMKFQTGQTPLSTEHEFGQLGAAFRGSVGFKNKARPPWAWFDESERNRPRGEWFFDPAAVIARHFGNDIKDGKFSDVYRWNRYFGIEEGK
ncbi:MAG: hypothetical protein HYR56_14995 [Acidobacteria bacterium]|nr:hypothetical protein [Acidobacteriota bacterium]MBI3422795.1 hypothetical protein [Acidobacteriota bacterium]